MVEIDSAHEHEGTEPESIENVERHPSFGRPRSKVGPVIAAAGFETFLDLAEALDVSAEYLSRLRHVREAMSAPMRRQLAELLDVPEDEALSALQGNERARTPDLDAHRLCLFSVLSARIYVLNDDVEDDDEEARELTGPMVMHEQWTDVACAAGCSVRTLMRIRREADIPTERMIERLSLALLVPPELVLIALRRRWTGWRW